MVSFRELAGSPPPPGGRPLATPASPPPPWGGHPGGDATTEALWAPAAVVFGAAAVGFVVAALVFLPAEAQVALPALVVVLLGAFYVAMLHVALPAVEVTWRPPFPVKVLVEVSLLTAFLAVTGGAHSPYFLVWYLQLAAVAVRETPWRIGLAAGAFVVGYPAAVVAAGGSWLLPDVVLRTSFGVLLATGVAALAWVLRSEVEARAQVEGVLDAARRREREVRELVDAIPHALIVTRPNGDILTVNRRANRLLGYRGAALRGRRLDLLLRGEFDLASAVDAAREGRDDRCALVVEVEAVRRDGSTFPAELRANPFTSRHGLLLVNHLRNLGEPTEDPDGAGWRADPGDPAPIAAG